jgi:ABC-2 type transport system permease protein
VTAPAEFVPARLRKGAAFELAARRAASQGALWGLAFAIVVYSSVTGYRTAYPTAAARQLFASTLAANPGAQALLGPAHVLTTVGGFTAWRASGTAMLIGAVWAILLSTRQLRGEEDAGRWELLLAGRSSRRSTTLQVVGGLAAGLLAMLVTTGIGAVLVGRTAGADYDARSAVFLAIALTASPALFLAVGALTSQLAGTRRRAAGLAASVFGLAFVIRMVAAISPEVTWLRWASPLGWIDELRPLTGSHPLALVPLFTVITGCLTTAIYLAGRRDLGASALPARDERAPWNHLLGGPTALGVRQTLPTAAAWVLGVGALAFVLGLVAKVAARSFAASARIRQLLAQLGGYRTGAASYLGFSFVIIATLVALAAASQVASSREEEADGRVEHLLVRPVSRARWLVGRVAIAVGLVVVVSLASAFAAWCGAALQDSGVSLRLMTEAGVNLIGPAVFVVGLGTLLHGAWPRATVVAVYGVVAWSFLVEIVGSLVKADHWLLDTSVLHHLRPAPAADVDWLSLLVLVGLGIALAAAGVAAFRWRDLASA